jgi:putative ABC transport system ATP-binding protein
MDILRTEGLTRQYGTGQTMVTALDNVDLQVERGQFVAIIGASGSGKSTLLHLLGGVDRPDGGKIFVEDVDIATFGEERLAQGGAYLPVLQPYPHAQCEEEHLSAHAPG